MKSKRDKIIFLMIFLQVLSACQTRKVFGMKTDTKKELNVITVDANRIVHECYFLNAEKENKWRHQYFLNILDNKNEVISVMYPINQDIDTCKEHLKKVEKVLKTSGQVRICGRNLLEVMNKEGVIDHVHDFGPLGKHTSSYEGLIFDTICNSKECYSISDMWTYTCPDMKNPDE